MFVARGEGNDPELHEGQARQRGKVLEAKQQKTHR